MILWGNSISFEDYPLEQALEIMHQAGFTGVEMWKPQLRRCRTAELRKRFAAYAAGKGLALGGLNVVGEAYFQPFGDEAQRRNTLEGVKADVDYAVSLGVRDVLIWEGIRPPGLSHRQVLDLLAPLTALLGAAVEYAKANGARILVEPHPFTVGMNDEFLIRLCDALPAQDFGITFDFCHYGVGRPQDYVQAVYRLGSRIQHVHFADTDQRSSELHLVPGEGVLDLTALLRALRDIGYSGQLALDLYGHPTPGAAARRGLPKLREANLALAAPPGTASLLG